MVFFLSMCTKLRPPDSGIICNERLNYTSRAKYYSSSSRFYMNEALIGVLGIQGEGLFIFRDLGRRVIYFQGFGKKA